MTTDRARSEAHDGARARPARSSSVRARRGRFAPRVELEHARHAVERQHERARGRDRACRERGAAAARDDRDAGLRGDAQRRSTCSRCSGYARQAGAPCSGEPSRETARRSPASVRTRSGPSAARSSWIHATADHRSAGEAPPVRAMRTGGARWGARSLRGAEHDLDEASRGGSGEQAVALDAGPREDHEARADLERLQPGGRAAVKVTVPSCAVRCSVAFRIRL